MSIHQECMRGNIDSIQQLIDAGANLNAVENYTIPLQIAVCANNVPLVELLVSAGADVSKAAAKRWTPLHDAGARGFGTIIDCLIKAGATVNAVDGALLTPLHLLLEHSVSVNAAQQLINAGAEINGYSRRGETPLHVAINHGNVEIVRFLAGFGADVVNKATNVRNSHWVPMHFAARHGSTEMLQILIDAGGDPQAREGNEEYTPLHIAAGNGHLEAVELLFRVGVDVNIINDSGKTPLQRTISFAQHSHNSPLPVIQFLISVGANVNTADDDAHRALHFAAGACDQDLVDALLVGGASTYVESFGETPVDYALHRHGVTGNTADITRMLLSHRRETCGALLL